MPDRPVYVIACMSSLKSVCHPGYARFKSVYTWGILTPGMTYRVCHTVYVILELVYVIFDLAYVIPCMSYCVCHTVYNISEYANITCVYTWGILTPGMS